MRGRHSSGVPVGIRTLLAVAGAGLLVAAGIVAILTLGGPASPAARAQRRRRDRAWLVIERAADGNRLGGGERA